MTNFRKIGSVFFAFLVLFLFNCGTDSEPSAEEKVKKILIGGDGKWEPTTTITNAITLDGNDVAEEFFSNFTIRFTADKIFTTGTTPVWLREDTWTFKPGSGGTIIIRGMDDKEISIVDISSSQLKLTLEWDETTYESGRNASLPGTYEFILDK